MQACHGAINDREGQVAQWRMTQLKHLRVRRADGWGRG
jgi:hypothetical protein